MTDEEKREVERERLAEYRAEERYDLIEDARDMNPGCYQCGAIIEGEYYRYDYYDGKGKPHEEDYCDDCLDEFMKDFRTQGMRHTSDTK